MTKIRIINPLGSALKHYTAALRATLEELGCEVEVVSLMEPSARDHRFGRLRWALEYLAALRRSPAESLLICAWPVFGYWDVVLMRLAPGRKKFLVVHDPDPMVPSVGFGRLADLAARMVGRRPWLIVHGSVALNAIREHHSLDATVVIHPMHLPVAAPARDAVGLDGTRIIRVLGQFKVGRSLEALKEVAESSDPGWRREIIGRGWPEVEGWNVRSEFVPEDEFNGLLAGADVVMIPYQRYFQSGVAVRVLELGIPVVAPRDPSMIHLLGKDCGWMADDGDWVSAVRRALSTEVDDATHRANDAYRRALSSWGYWLAEVQGPD